MTTCRNFDELVPVASINRDKLNEHNSNDGEINGDFSFMNLNLPAIINNRSCSEVHNCENEYKTEYYFQNDKVNVNEGKVHNCENEYKTEYYFQNDRVNVHEGKVHNGENEYTNEYSFQHDRVNVHEGKSDLENCENISQGDPSIAKNNKEYVNSNVTKIQNPDSTYVRVSSEYKIYCWNIQGIGSKLELESIQQVLSGFDIIFLFETMKLNSFQPNFKDYNYYHCQRAFQHPRARRPAGGIAVLIKNNLVKHVKIEKINEYVIWLKISQKSQPPIFIGGTYIPPSGSKFYLHTSHDDIFTNLRQDLAKFFQYSPLVALCGDFNSRTGKLDDFDRYRNGKDADLFQTINNGTFNGTGNSKWYTENRQSKDESHNNFGKELVNLCKSCNMRIMNGFYNVSHSNDFTCYAPLGKSIVDYLICTESFYKLLANFFICSKLVESDHTPLQFKFNVEFFLSNPHSIMKPKKKQVAHYYYVYNKEKLQNYKDNLKSNASQEHLQFVCNNIYDNASSDTVIAAMYDYLTQCIDPVFKKKSVKSTKNKFPTNAWYDNECKLVRKTVNVYAKEHDICIPKYDEQYKYLYKIYRSTIQRKKRLYHKMNREKLYSLQGQSQTTCWKVWNDLTMMSNKPNNQPNLEIFHDYFKGQTHPPDFDYFDQEHMSDIDSHIEQYNKNCTNTGVSPALTDLSLNEQICDSTITEDEVFFHIKKLKSNKASGIDGIPGEFFKFVSDELTTPFCVIFNYILDKGDYPSQWSEGLINALHKKGDPSNPDNYRKITISVAMAKIFDSILNSRLYFKNDAMAIDDPFQFGFTPNRRTTDCVFVLDTVIKHQQNLKKPIFLCFVDFTKAFDYINRNALFYKLQNQGMGRKMLNVIMSMFKKAEAKVFHEGKFGDPIDSIFGVLQGGILSPKMFNEYLSDFSKYLNQKDGIAINETYFTHLLYADDIVLMSGSAEGLQSSLNNLHTFCSKWHLIVNTTKTKVMQINSRNTLKFQYNGQYMENVDSYKYLGHIINNHKSIHNKMSEYLCMQAQKALFALSGKTKAALGYLPPTLAIKMFDTYVLPILEYNNMLWGKNTINLELEKIQLGYLKCLLGVRKQTPTLAIYAETGRFPLLVRQKVGAMKYWSRLVNLPHSDILHKCLIIQRELYEKGQINFYGKIIEITSQLQINNLEYTQSDKVVTEVKLKLYAKEQERILNEIHNSTLQPKLRSYKLFKSTYCIEPYLTLNLSKKSYKSISRFRTTSHNLKIETGRHETPKIPLNERICLKCNSKEIEDEIHCLLVCSYNITPRIKLIDTVSLFIPNFTELNYIEQFIAIMSCKEKEVIYALSNYLTEVL